MYETWKRAANILREARRELRRRPAVRILDIGCAQGNYSFVLQSLDACGVGSVILGIDTDRGALSLAASIGNELGVRRVRFAAADALRLPLRDGEWDCALCAEVIEHIPRPEILLREIRRVLKPGGALILSTPNRTNLARNPFKKRPVREDDPHVSVKGVGEWKRVFKQHGFRLERLSRGSLLQGGPRWDRYPLFFACALVVDTVLDLLPGGAHVSENTTFTLRR